MAKTLLIVDDDIDYLEQLEVQLKAAGYEVMAAHSESEAAELLKDKRPDMAIVDLMMEEVDGGFSLCYHIKRLDASIPVLLVTGVAAETGYEFDASTDEEQGWIKADAVLAKPVRFEQLEREIKRLLD